MYVSCWCVTWLLKELKVKKLPLPQKMAKIRGGGLEVKGKGEGESNKKINLFLKTEKERKKNCESF